MNKKAFLLSALIMIGTPIALLLAFIFIPPIVVAVVVIIILTASLYYELWYMVYKQLESTLRYRDWRKK